MCGRPSHRGLLVPVAFLVVLGIVSAPTLAAGVTDVRLEPSATTVDVDETTTFEVVVTDVSGGVGSYDLRVRLADSTVANLTAASGLGNPEFEDSPIEDANSTVVITATGADTANDDSVTIASVTVRGVGPGQTPVELAVTSVSDEDGREYAVSNLSGSTLTVEETRSDRGNDGGESETDASDGDDDSTDSTDGVAGGGGPTPTATPTPTPTATPTPTPTMTPTSTPTSTATPTPKSTTASTPDEATASTSTQFPGFGAAVTVVALLVAALAAPGRET